MFATTTTTTRRDRRLRPVPLRLLNRQSPAEWVAVGRDLRRLGTSAGLAAAESLTCAAGVDHSDDGGDVDATLMSAVDCFARAVSLDPDRVASLTTLAAALNEIDEAASTPPLPPPLAVVVASAVAGTSPLHVTALVAAECALERDDASPFAWLQLSVARYEVDRRRPPSSPSSSTSSSLDAACEALSRDRSSAGIWHHAARVLALMRHRRQQSLADDGDDDGDDLRRLDSLLGGAVAPAPATTLSAQIHCLNRAVLLGRSNNHSDDAVRWAELADAYRTARYGEAAIFAASRALELRQRFECDSPSAGLASAWLLLGLCLCPSPQGSRSSSGHREEDHSTVPTTRTATLELAVKDPTSASTNLLTQATTVKCVDCFSAALLACGGDGRLAAEAWHGVGCALGRDEATVVLGRVFTQHQCFTRALAAEPRSKHVWNNLGVALGTDDETVTVNGVKLNRVGCFVQALRLDKAYRQAWLNLGSALADDVGVRIDDETVTAEECLARGGAKVVGHRRRWACVVA